MTVSPLSLLRRLVGLAIVVTLGSGGILGCDEKADVVQYPAQCPPEDDGKPVRVWDYTGPRVYLISDTLASSDGLFDIRRDLQSMEHNARVFSSDEDGYEAMLEDMEDNRDQIFILVGHGTGGEAALDATEYWADCDPRKQIRAVILLDAIDPEELEDRETIEDTQQLLPPPPRMLPPNIDYVYNFVQRNDDNRFLGYSVIEPRAGRELRTDSTRMRVAQNLVTGDLVNGTRNVEHASIDNAPSVQKELIRLIRLHYRNSFSYTSTRFRMGLEERQGETVNNPPNGQIPLDSERNGNGFNGNGAMTIEPAPNGG